MAHPGRGCRTEITSTPANGRPGRVRSEIPKPALPAVGRPCNGCVASAHGVTQSSAVVAVGVATQNCHGLATTAMPAVAPQPAGGGAWTMPPPVRDTRPNATGGMPPPPPPVTHCPVAASNAMALIVPIGTGIAVPEPVVGSTSNRLGGPPRQPTHRWPVVGSYANDDTPAGKLAIVVALPPFTGIAEITPFCRSTKVPIHIVVPVGSIAMAFAMAPGRPFAGIGVTVPGLPGE